MIVFTIQIDSICNILCSSNSGDSLPSANSTEDFYQKKFKDRRYNTLQQFNLKILFEAKKKR